MKIEINNLTNRAVFNRTVDKKVFSTVAKIVLKGENREIKTLSLAFVGKDEIKKLNKKFRHKNKLLSYYACNTIFRKWIPFPDRIQVTEYGHKGTKAQRRNGLQSNKKEAGDFMSYQYRSSKKESIVGINMNTIRSNNLLRLSFFA